MNFILEVRGCPVITKWFGFYIDRIVVLMFFLFCWCSLLQNFCNAFQNVYKSDTQQEGNTSSRQQCNFRGLVRKLASFSVSFKKRNDSLFFFLITTIYCDKLKFWIFERSILVYTFCDPERSLCVI